MKLSILTPTYNRASLIRRVYESILKNLNSELEVEWLIMDDGSMDKTEIVIKEIQDEKKLDIKYYKQKNQGKMSAINNLMEYVTGDFVVECDSDDWFFENAFSKIEKGYEECKNEKDLYGMCFLKYDQEGRNVGKNFKEDKTTMFDLYFKELEDGEKSIVFFTEVRKKYKYKLEKNEKFITEARMYHEMDLTYKMKCYNEPIMTCEFQDDGYTKNINKVFKNNPYGYFEYFKEILSQHDMAKVPFKKRLYVIKHYILFSNLTKNKRLLKDIKGALNRFLLIILYIPGNIKTNMTFKVDSL